MDGLYGQGSFVWVQHVEYVWYPARVEEILADGSVLAVTEELQITLTPDKVHPVHESCLHGVEDLLSLGDFNESTLLHNVRVRYAKDDIYTSIGSPIVISLNPYKKLAKLYSNTTANIYRQLSKTPQGSASPAPHVFSMADAAYRSLMTDSSNQSIIISGESGAGKTEATKIILQYLANTANKTDNKAEGGVEKQVLDSNPVLEAFGNAKTTRNDNSSRFGKFIEVQFEMSGKLTGARIVNYLLEKSRIVRQQEDERNYHIFYQLCAGATDEERIQWSLGPADSFYYLSQSNCFTIDEVDDVEQFELTKQCMNNLGFTEQEKDDVFRILSGILHIGNIMFGATESSSGETGSQIDNPDELDMAASLFSVDVERLKNVLTLRTIVEPVTKREILRILTPSDAEYSREALAKAVYGNLFDWMVWRVNASICKSQSQKHKLIGLLDIYGFEVFQVNSFEQLCINYANEKLQQHFNHHMFKLEQEEYRKEKINWDNIEFKDNQDTIDAIERKPIGLVALLDEECILPRGTDSNFLNKLIQNHAQGGVIYPTKSNIVVKNCFSIAHYAGPVSYNVEGFLDKNNDKLHSDITSMLANSSCTVLKQLFDPAALSSRSTPAAGQLSTSGTRPRGASAAVSTGTGSPAGRASTVTANKAGSAGRGSTTTTARVGTVGSQFKEQLVELMELLQRTHPRYVRCIKPNAFKQPLLFDSADVLRQLKCAGMLEAIRIRRAGYSIRRVHSEFYNRYRVLAPNVRVEGGNYAKAVKELLARLSVSAKAKTVLVEGKHWQLGVTKIFTKDETRAYLDQQLNVQIAERAIVIQKYTRRFIYRKAFLQKRIYLIRLQTRWRGQLARRQLRLLKAQTTASVIIQKCFRGFAARKMFDYMLGALLHLQKMTRGFLVRKNMGATKERMTAKKVEYLRREEERRAAVHHAKELETQAVQEKQRYESELRRMQDEAEKWKREAQTSQSSRQTQKKPVGNKGTDANEDADVEGSNSNEAIAMWKARAEEYEAKWLAEKKSVVAMEELVFSLRQEVKRKEKDSLQYLDEIASLRVEIDRIDSSSNHYGSVPPSPSKPHMDCIRCKAREHLQANGSQSAADLLLAQLGNEKDENSNTDYISHILQEIGEAQGDLSKWSLQAQSLKSTLQQNEQNTSAGLENEPSSHVEVSLLRSQLSKKDGQVKDMESQLKAKEDELVTLSETLQSLREKDRELRDRFESESRKWKNQQDELSQALKAQTRELDKKEMEMERKLSKAQEDRNKLEASLQQKLKEQQADFEVETERLSARVQLLEMQADEKQTEMREVHMELSKAKAELDRLRTDLAKRRQSVDNNTKTMIELESIRLQEEEKWKNLMNEVIKKKDGEIKKVVEQMELMRNQVVAMRTSMGEVMQDTTLTHANSELKNKMEELGKWRAKAERQTSEIEALQHELHQKMDDAERMRSTTEYFRMQAQRRQTDLKQKQTELDEKSAELDRVKQFTDELTAQVQMWKERAEELERIRDEIEPPSPVSMCISPKSTDRFKNSIRSLTDQLRTTDMELHEKASELDRSKAVNSCLNTLLAWKLEELERLKRLHGVQDDDGRNEEEQKVYDELETLLSRQVDEEDEEEDYFRPASQLDLDKTSALSSPSILPSSADSPYVPSSSSAVSVSDRHDETDVIDSPAEFVLPRSKVFGLYKRHTSIDDANLT